MWSLSYHWRYCDNHERMVIHLDAPCERATIEECHEPIPNLHSIELYDFQRDTIHALRRCQHLPLLSQKMGAGKTIMCLGALMGDGPHLVMCGLANMRNWMSHIQNHTHLSCRAIACLNDITDFKDDADIILLPTDLRYQDMGDHIPSVAGVSMGAYQFVKGEIVKFHDMPAEPVSAIMRNLYPGLRVGTLVLDDFACFNSSRQKLVPHERMIAVCSNAHDAEPGGISVRELGYERVMELRHDNINVRSCLMHFHVLNLTVMSGSARKLFGILREDLDDLVSMGMDAISQMRDVPSGANSAVCVLMGVISMLHNRLSDVKRGRKHLYREYHVLEKIRDVIQNDECEVCSLAIDDTCVVYNCCMCMICTDCHGEMAAKSLCPYCATRSFYTQIDKHSLSDMISNANFGKYQNMNRVPSTVLSAKYKLHMLEETLMRIFHGQYKYRNIHSRSKLISPDYLLTGSADVEPEQRTVAVLADSKHVCRNDIALMMGQFTTDYHVVNKPKHISYLTRHAVINTQVCRSGVNLPHYTDIIIYHRYDDEKRIEQLVGRFRRITSWSNLHVYRLFYEWEQE